MRREPGTKLSHAAQDEEVVGASDTKASQEPTKPQPRWVAQPADVAALCEIVETESLYFPQPPLRIGGAASTIIASGKSLEYKRFSAVSPHGRVFATSELLQETAAFEALKRELEAKGWEHFEK
jgi:hypothetical protein